VERGDVRYGGRARHSRVGEASYATLAPTIIDDVAPPTKRGSWLSIFYAAMPIGSALGYIVGSAVGNHFGWRAAFFVAGGPGAVLAIVCLLIVEPPRVVLKERPDMLGSLRSLWNSRPYRQGVFGYCAYTFAVGGFSYWAPTFIFRRFELSSTIFGLVTVAAGFGGTMLGGAWADRMAKKSIDLELSKHGPPSAETEEKIRDHASITAYMRVCAIGSAIGAPLAAAAFVAPNAALFFVIVRSVPAGLRASAMAISILAIHCLGDAWSPPLIGLAFDHVSPSLGMMFLAVAIAVSAAIWWKRPAPVAEST
jgi:MFS family permease